MRLAELLVRRLEPANVECALLQILDRDGRVFRDHARAFLRDVAHVRLEVVAAARHAAPAEVCLDERDPLRRVHRRLDETLLGDARVLQRRL